MSRGGRIVGVAMVISAQDGQTRGRNGRLIVGLLFAALVAGLAAPAADAKVWFGDLQGRELSWGQRVSSTIAGCPGNDSCRATVQGVAVYLRRGPVRTHWCAPPPPAPTGAYLRERHARLPGATCRGRPLSPRRLGDDR